MKASKQNLDCAETILRQHGIDNRALRRDIALTIDQAEEAAAAPLRKEVEDLLQTIRRLTQEQPYDERF